MIRIGRGRKTGVWTAVAYHGEGLTMEIGSGLTREIATEQLAAKLVARMTAVSILLDTCRGSVPFGAQIEHHADIEVFDDGQ